MGAKKSGTDKGGKRGKKATKNMQDLPADRSGKAIKGGDLGGVRATGVRLTDEGPEESITFVYGKF